MAPTAFSPILTADGDGAGERVDLGMAGPSLTDPAKNELECRRETVVVCRVCHRAYAKYTCPRCHTKYCDLACYKTHDPRCVESFHGDNLGNAMKGLRVEDEEKRRVTVLLAKYAPGGDSSRGGVPGESSGGSSETSSSESDESEEEDWDAVHIRTRRTIRRAESHDPRLGAVVDVVFGEGRRVGEKRVGDGGGAFGEIVWAFSQNKPRWRRK
jgi:hypothetical protein